MRKIALVVLLGAAAPALAQMEPGEWQFNSTTSSKALKQPQVSMNRQCLRKEEAGSPRAWMGQRSPRDCQMTDIRRGGDTWAWDISCAKTGWTGSGSATVSMKGRAVQAQSRVGGAGATGKAPKGKQYEEIEIVTKVDGKRVGPCR